MSAIAFSSAQFSAHRAQRKGPYVETAQRPSLDFSKSISLQRKFNELIPGGSHTYAKGDDQFPEFIPPYIVRGKGCRVWDVDGNELIEFGMGLRSVALGHAFDPIVAAAQRQMTLGTNFGRPSMVELECAEELLSILKGADMVKFCKNGSDAVDGAVRLARAYTGRDMMAICADHPFFSTGDWFIGSTPVDAGIPDSTKAQTVKFRYNDLQSAEDLFNQYPGKIAAFILEPQKYDEPQDDFLNKLKDLCHKNGALFIFDEMITGFRWHLGGGQRKYDVVPDLSTWGKAIGNGFAVAALTGKRDIMQLGGLRHNQARVFLLSTTHGAESHALAAVKAVIHFYRENNVIERLYEQGDKLEAGINKIVNELNIQEFFGIVGPGCCSAYFTRDLEGHPSQAFRTLFLQETLKRGLMMPSTVISYSHTDADIVESCDKIYEALYIYKSALNEGVEKFLEGRSVKPVWRKFN
jgi:glutamate-1-semialdehyde 2,1-aminomutase